MSYFNFTREHHPSSSFEQTFDNGKSSLEKRNGWSQPAYNQ